MKTYKKIMAEGLVLAGLLGMFGCNLAGTERLASFEYKTKSSLVYERTSKVEDFLEEQGFTLMNKDYSNFTNTGEALYEKDKTSVNIKMELYSGDDLSVYIRVKTLDKSFELRTLEEEIHEIMMEKTK